MTKDSEADTSAADAIRAIDARDTHSWFDSTWELRRGLEVIEDVPLHLWPAGFSGQEAADLAPA